MYRNAGALLLLLAVALVGCNPNKPPAVQLSANKTQLYAGIEELQVQFSATDPDGSVVECTLNFGDGTVEQIVSCALGSRTHTYSQAGTYTVSLIAKDDDGAMTRKSLSVRALNSSQTCYAALGPQATLQSAPAPQGLAFAEDAVFVPGQLLALPMNPAGPVTLQRVQTPQIEGVRPLRLIEPPEGSDGFTWVLYETAPGQEEAAAKELLRSGAARYVQPNYFYRQLTLTVPPNDSFYASDQSAQFKLVGLEAAWPLVRSETDDTLDPIVAIIDSGVARTHEDLSANWSGITGKDFSSEGGTDGQPTSSSGAHGTLVASIVAATTHNSKGVAGVTYNTTTYISYKVFPDATSDVLAQAINRAVTDGANVINLSLCILNGSGTCANMYDNPDTVIETALQHAYSAGLVAVAASGNFGDAWVGYPASSPYTIAVGSVNASGSHSSFSNSGTRLDLAAPGENMTGADYPITSGGNPAYASRNGTSFSAPVVTGVAALYMRQYQAIKGNPPSPKQVAKCLCTTAQDKGNPGFDVDYGAGIVRANGALDTSNPICYP